MNSTTHAAARVSSHATTSRQTDAGLMYVTIDYGGPALEQHCPDGSR